MSDPCSEVFPDGVVIAAIKNHVSVDLEDESVILNLSDGVYYGLNTVGSAIWALIQDPTTFGEIRTRLLQEYEVDPQQCEEAIHPFLQDMKAKGLIEIKSDSQS